MFFDKPFIDYTRMQKEKDKNKKVSFILFKYIMIDFYFIELEYLMGVFVYFLIIFFEKEVFPFKVIDEGSQSWKAWHPIERLGE